MVSITSLWMPILVSAALSWVAAALIWTVLPHHRKDFGKVPNEEAARSALKGLEPGQYNVPHCATRADAETPEGRAKFEEGPNAFITVLPRGVPAMGRNMVLMFIFNVFIGVMVAYVAGRTLAPGADYLSVFRIVGVVAWLAYGMAVIPDAVWFGRPWSSVIKNLLDALIFALLTAGAFGWLWPGLG